jgi:ribonuclease D
MTAMQPITAQSELAEFCESVAQEEYLTVDTEFIRERTYYPRLCLIQIAGSEKAALIDPLADGIDLAPVFELLQNPKIIKVFHAARQDIEIFYLLSKKIPAPIFDTQVAAAVCGFGESAGYESLVNQIVAKEIDKSSRFTDWAQRPLSEKQLAYALSDVTHLRVIYEKLKEKIEEEGRTTWIAEEHVYLSDPALYDPNPDEAWKRLRVGNLKPKQLAILRELARWREQEAIKHDVPRGRIVKDDALVELALSAPRKEADLSRIRSIGNISQGRMAAIFNCVETALALPASDYPASAKYRRLPAHVASALSMLQLLLKISADQHGVSAGIIANKDDLEKIALAETDTPALSGWRYDIFGRAAEKLLRGELKLSLHPKTKQVVLEETA